MIRRFTFQKSLSVLLALLLSGSLPAGAEKGPHYAGIEFYGSSQITKMELEKLLGLRKGDSFQSVNQAVIRLDKKLEERHLKNTVELVQAPPDEVFVVVDIVDSYKDQIPVRQLSFPHHITLTTEKPLALLEQLHDRLATVTAQGRNWTENYKEGIKYFSDEPANQIVDDILKYAPSMRKELLTVAACDPDNMRRANSIELLNWAGNVPETSALLINTLDDSDVIVRANTARYLFPRLDMLGDDFPYPQLIMALSRQMRRPSHEDRSKALYCLLSIAKLHPPLAVPMKQIDQEKVLQLEQATVLPTIKAPAHTLALIFEKAMIPKPVLPATPNTPDPNTPVLDLPTEKSPLF